MLASRLASIGINRARRFPLWPLPADAPAPLLRLRPFRINALSVVAPSGAPDALHDGQQPAFLVVVVW